MMIDAKNSEYGDQNDLASTIRSYQMSILCGGISIINIGAKALILTALWDFSAYELYISRLYIMLSKYHKHPLLSTC